MEDDLKRVAVWIRMIWGNLWKLIKQRGVDGSFSTTRAKFARLCVDFTKYWYLELVFTREGFQLRMRGYISHTFIVAVTDIRWALVT